MQNFVLSMFAFIIIYLLYLTTVILRKKKLEKFKNNTYVKYLEMVYHLDIRKVNIKKLANTIALTNAFIIALTLYLVSITESIFLKLLLAFAIFIPLQLLFYHIIGKKYQKKTRRKENV